MIKELRNQLKLKTAVWLTRPGATLDGSEGEEEEEFHVCCANGFCAFDWQPIHNVDEEARECMICQNLCHIDCGTGVKDVVDESLVFACKECHSSFY